MGGSAGRGVRGIANADNGDARRDDAARATQRKCCAWGGEGSDVWFARIAKRSLALRLDPRMIAVILWLRDCDA